MKKFALIVEYGTGRAVMLTDYFDLEKALKEFNKHLKKAFPFEYKDFALPMVTSCELLPISYNSFKEGKRFALVCTFRSSKSVMVTDATDILMGLFKLKKERQKQNPADMVGSAAIQDIISCELLPVLYGE